MATLNDRGRPAGAGRRRPRCDRRHRLRAARPPAQLARESGLAAELHAERVPALRRRAGAAGGRGRACPAGARRNRRLCRQRSPRSGGVSEPRRRLLCDPTTSGGLLVSLGRDRIGEFDGTSIGRMVEGEPGAIRRSSSRRAERPGLGAPAGLQSRPAVAIPRSEGSTPSPLRLREMSDRRVEAPGNASGRCDPCRRSIAWRWPWRASALAQRRAELLAGAGTEDDVDLVERARIGWARRCAGS